MSNNTTETNTTPATTPPETSQKKEKDKMTESQLAAAHEALEKAGYKVGGDKAAKVYGDATEKAVRYYQADHGLYITGRIDEKTAEKLKIKT
jgi:peptidoglycan hydrolase-like protein with peptidoglycan-binding domain